MAANALCTFSVQCCATSIRNLKLLASSGSHSFPFTIQVPSSFFTTVPGGLYLFCSRTTPAIVTGIIFVDAGVISLHGAATWRVYATGYRYPLDYWVSISANTFINTPIWFMCRSRGVLHAVCSQLQRTEGVVQLVRLPNMTEIRASRNTAGDAVIRNTEQKVRFTQQA